MTTKEFAIVLATVFRKRAITISTNGVTRGSNETSQAIASTLGELADDIERMASSMQDDPPKPPRKEWEYLT